MKRNCQNCGTEFTTYLNWIKRGGGKFCSQSCRGKFLDKKIDKVCMHCRVNFKIKKSTSIHNASKYCSPKCSQEASKGKKRPNCSGNKIHTWKGGKTLVNKNCMDCGVSIYYRSDRCYSCSKTAELSPHWLGGITKYKYPNIFNQKLKDRIRIRDNYVCKLCDITEEEHIIVLGKNLAIHHIDYDKDNCCDENLLTLCISCNIRVNYNRKYWTERFTNFLTKKEN